ncbi:RebB family R body protein [Paraneptunicella aestuarii]|uniref:RebB family R body protein n=1 Tax=Paraneptunicella aestuarii TaxID=2831148 RepID=UPI001E53E039|nr:RebB family R body protein [Paraneptunicella aestuarii]UAA37895.1 RebB family R body protein [Paraneptunicella aestuarii]
MTDSNKNDQQDKDKGGTERYSPFSVQPTTLVETSFAGSLGLSMHNEVNNQQSARLASLAATTNACKLILSAKLSGGKAPEPKKVAKAGSESSPEAGSEAVKEPEKTEKSSFTKRLNLGNFLGRKKPDDTAPAGNTAASTTATASTTTKESDTQENTDSTIKPTGLGDSNESTEPR